MTATVPPSSTTSLLVTLLTPPDPLRTACLAGIKLGIPRSGNPSTVGVCSDLAVLGALLVRRLVPQAGAYGISFFTWRGAIGSFAGIFVPPENKRRAGQER